MQINRYRQSKELLERSKKVLAGGVSSEFRKYNHPHAIFYSHGKGSKIYDVDGNEYLDFTLSQGPLILGHSPEKVLKAVSDYSVQGQIFAGQHIQELELAEKIQSIVPSAERMRFCLDGSEAVQTAFRVARAKTGRQKFLRFEGHYHGWMDNVCWGISCPDENALGTRENPNVFAWSQGLPNNSREDFIILPWNDLELVKKKLETEGHNIAAVITEAVMCNSGCIPPARGFLQGLRDLCTQYGIAFILDEVITGFRLSLGGAQQYFNLQPDLSIFAKAMGNGYPISAIVGKQEWMQLIEEGKVIHAGTMNAGHPSVAAALATINILQQEQPYDRMFMLGKKLMDGLQNAAKNANQNLLVQGMGPMFSTTFTTLKANRDYRDTLHSDKAKLGKFIAAMHDMGIRIIGRGLWYISATHSEEDIDRAIEVATKVFHVLDK
ncbi:MAG: aspartate aminotransferase family protein [Ginsengibacter sp.]